MLEPIETQALLVRHAAALRVLKAEPGLRGSELLLRVVVPSQESLEASLEVAREKGVSQRAMAAWTHAIQEQKTGAKVPRGSEAEKVRRRVRQGDGLPAPPRESQEEGEAPEVITLDDLLALKERGRRRVRGRGVAVRHRHVRVQARS